MASSGGFCTQCGAPLDSRPQPAGELLNALRVEVHELRRVQDAGQDRLRRLEASLEALAGALTEARGDSRFSTQPGAEAEATPVRMEQEPPLGAGGQPGEEFRFQPGPAESAAALRDQSLAQPLTTPAAARTRRRPPKEARAPKGSFEGALGQKWLLAVGIVVMVFGLGYFLKYTFDKGIIGPLGQVGLAYCWSVLLLAGGELARRKGYKVYGLWVLAGGVGSLYFSTFAGYRIYELMGVVPAFALLVGATALAIALALRHDVKGLAVLGILGGFLTPLVLSSGEDNMYFLFGYLAILNAGVLATAFFRSWSGLSWLGVLGTLLLFASWYADFYEITAFWPTFLFVSVVFLGYTLAPAFGAALAQDTPERPRKPASDVYLGIPTSFVAFGYTYEMVVQRFSQEASALPCLGYALVFGVCALLLHRSAQRPRAAAILAANAALFATLAVPLACDAHWITIIWALQGALMLYLASIFRGRGLPVCGQLLLLLALGRYLFLDLPDTFGWLTDPALKDLRGASYTFYGGYTRMLAGRLLTEAVLLGSLFAGVWFSSHKGLSTATAVSPTPWGRGGRAPGFIFIFALLLILSVECAAFFGDYALEARAAAMSVLWGLFATGLMLFGFMRRSPGARHLALGLFAFTLFKVVLVDMERFATPYRILSFLVLGSLLVGASFLYHRHRDRLEDRLGREQDAPES
jgi:uncharacterized membrane protein